ncbi:MAG: asparagine synthase (glutamine-hydrolyzing) [Oscillospiraceae bacterium]|nr:asparagine synthase (glutamine-hydrolyzing) [Oscillospiraceae bacterium]MDD3832498.1 asparagine synthase (glutamine-hydrolyzing) [Oscillospiraceae bacterium]MDD4546335.1 asparagine synthase (glutamine-hydrolyzing) [Oscillospiraceae bacterium]
MCGFCGFTGQVAEREKVIQKMTNLITHRGPDSEGFYINGEGEDGITIGFRRLSIIDLEGGNQPIYNEDKSLVLMFNGEIYNYQPLQNELTQKGHKFTSQSDSEVLIHGFEEWGAELLPRLRGMFAFVIRNNIDHSLFIARDYFGIKPMHYTLLDDRSLIFGSEIKCFTAHPDFKSEFNERALDDYLSFQYSFPHETFFKGVFCLPPAHYLLYKNGEVTQHRYWEPSFHPDENMPLDKAVDEIDRVFTDSVNAHRISDVEVGCFLSSGVDSSYVASYFAGQKAFTVGFDNGSHYNESEYAATLAKQVGIEHYTHIIKDDEYWDSLSDVQYYLDQPLADPACVALYFVSRLASQHVKVVLSGEGADELFGGYRIYHEPYSLMKYQKLPRRLRKAFAVVVSKLPDFKGKSFIIRGSKSLEERFIGNANIFNQQEKSRLLKNITATNPSTRVTQYYEPTKGQDDVTRMQYIDINCWMVGDILLKADRMSMAHSLELRVPFLDKEVFSVAARIPAKHRIACKTTKYAMRLAAKRHISDQAADKPKLGFPVPIRVWLRQEKYYNRVKEAFTSSTSQHFFNTEELIKLLDQHYNGKKDNSRKIWTIYMFLLWYDVYFNKKP